MPTAAPARADRHLAIIVDDTPAPVGKPLEVLAPEPPRRAVAPPRATGEPVAPRPAPNGLVRVVAPVPGPLAHAPAPQIVAPARPEKIEAVAAPVHPAPVHPKPAAKAHAVETAKLQKASAKTRADKRHAPKTEVADAAPKSRHGLGALAHAFAKLAPHHAKAEPVEHAEATPPRHKPASTHLAKAEPRREKPPAPIKVASIQPRCASADPGEALACGDPSLVAAERRLNRAYRDAEAAGVPPATLERQQQRWRSARAAAAREAPWAVKQVYQARIAELQDQARDARGD